LSEARRHAQAERRAQLEARLGYGFRDPALLESALSHSSLAGRAVAGRGFERLEFLGDRVLGLIAAELLIERFPGESEGDLGRRFALLVSAPTLAALAQEIHIADALLLAHGEERTGGRRNPAVLADAFEAVLGAIFRDGGFAAASSFLRPLLLAQIDAATTPPRDPKTALQEWAQARGLTRPDYRVLEAAGPAHQPRFVVAVAAAGRTATGEGASKRVAERVAAAALLDLLAAR
jgi:ribonuclease-3